MGGKGETLRLLVSLVACTVQTAMAVSNFQIFCAVAAVAVATFINLPAPRFSQRLQEWRIMGQYFNYRGNAIFYQGKLYNEYCGEHWRQLSLK